MPLRLPEKNNRMIFTSERNKDYPMIGSAVSLWMMYRSITSCVQQ